MKRAASARERWRLVSNNQPTRIYMKTFDTQPDFVRPMGVPAYNVPLETLEHWRDQMAARLARVCREPAGSLYVDGFEQQDTDTAKALRGRLCCDLLRSIDHVNTTICKRIAPTFRVSPSEGFSDRVMHLIRPAPPVPEVAA